MAKSNGSRIKSIPLEIGIDPSLWRFTSLQEALSSCTELIAQGIQAHEEQLQANEHPINTGNINSQSEGA